MTVAETMSDWLCERSQRLNGSLPVSSTHATAYQAATHRMPSIAKHNMDAPQQTQGNGAITVEDIKRMDKARSSPAGKPPKRFIKRYRTEVASSISSICSTTAGVCPLLVNMHYMVLRIITVSFGLGQDSYANVQVQQFCRLCATNVQSGGIGWFL